MAAIHDLLAQVKDDALRNRLEKEIEGISKKKQFGLVFEEHIPECTPLYDVPVRKGSHVAIRHLEITETFLVESVIGGKASCVSCLSGEKRVFDENKLVVVAEFGEPIYPYLKMIDVVCNAPESDLWHTLIEADNYHALQLLQYIYAGRVDCIYIDPPYNNGVSNWKYNNNIIDDNDSYKHSKWLSMMKRRLIIAKKLLNPKSSLLIVTIDDKEYLRLGCLLEELFSGSKITMISSVINPAGKAKKGGIDFSRTDEFVFFVQIGDCPVLPETRDQSTTPIAWETFRRHSLANARGRHGVGACGPNQFYPFYIDNSSREIKEIGDPIPENVSRFSVKDIPGCSTVFPVRDNGIEMNWGAPPAYARELLGKGFLRVGQYSPDAPQQYSIKYLTKGTIKAIQNGEVILTEKSADGTVNGYFPTGKPKVPTTNWNKPTHNATSYGTDIINKILCDSRFDYPKSIYAVRDCINIFFAEKKDAIILDFFAGSGTTLHAVNLMNATDQGRRRCILVTNNEVSKEEAVQLTAKGYFPGDDEWERLGIARYVTWPRIKCSILGTDIKGNSLQGVLLTTATEKKAKKRKIIKIDFIKEVLTNTQKKSIVSIISQGRLPQNLIHDESEYVLSEKEKHTVSILFNTELADEWIEALSNNTHINELYIVTDNQKVFSDIKKKINETLNEYYEEVPISIPMSSGFMTNAIFFKLGFLNKTPVGLGRHLTELLPVLWLKAGAYGACPCLEDKSAPMVVLPKNRLAILVNEKYYLEFNDEVDKYPEIQTIFIITDSEAGYREMIARYKDKETIQLYRDYLDNFRINAGR